MIHVTDEQIEDIANEAISNLLYDAVYHDEPRKEVFIQNIEEESRLAVDDLKNKIFDKIFELLEKENIHIIL